MNNNESQEIKEQIEYLAGKLLALADRLKEVEPGIWNFNGKDIEIFIGDELGDVIVNKSPRKGRRSTNLRSNN